MAASTVANSDSFKVDAPPDREIRLTRLFDAPRTLGSDENGRTRLTATVASGQR